MKTLYLLRHAKSSWKDSSLRDHDRPLKKRGERAAAAMAQWMKEEGLVPGLVLCSTSKRTTDTWRLMAPVLGEDIPVEYDRVIYGAPPERLYDLVRGRDDPEDVIMLVGHNPNFQELGLALSSKEEYDEQEDERRLEVAKKFPTAGLMVLEADVERWADIEPGDFDLTLFMKPKALPDAEERRL